jgi:aspartyl-tRNA(Asn)/glutamyl-tRNA(Gln) amidotransferase subunit A
LEQLGARRVEVKLANAAMYSTVSAVILGSESAAYHETRLRKYADRMDPLVRERLEASGAYSAVDYVQAMRMRTLLIEEVRQMFRNCDVLMLPAGNAAPRLEEEIVDTDAPRDPPLAPRPDVYNLANVTGIPAIVIPCGFTAWPPALPIGIQFCARPFQEATLLTLAHAYQSVTDWHTRAPKAANGPFL